MPPLMTNELGSARVSSHKSWPLVTPCLITACPILNNNVCATPSFDRFRAAEMMARQMPVSQVVEVDLNDKTFLSEPAAKMGAQQLEGR